MSFEEYFKEEITAVELSKNIDEIAQHYLQLLSQTQEPLDLEIGARFRCLFKIRDWLIEGQSLAVSA